MLPRASTIGNEQDDTNYQRDTETSRIIKVKKDKIVVASNFRETTPSSSAYPEAIEKTGHKELVPNTNWWVCCNVGCRREINFAIWGDSCPDCSHERCSYCVGISKIQ